MENTQPGFRGVVTSLVLGMCSARTDHRHTALPSRRKRRGGWSREFMHMVLPSGGLTCFKLEVDVASETSLSHITPASVGTSPSKDDT